MKRIGLTGGIATGKSTVASFFVQCGAGLVDADRMVHELYAHDTTMQRAIRETFGDQVMAKDGTVDRLALGKIVLSDANALHELEAIVHPATRHAMALAAEALAAAGKALCIFDIPLLFESGGEWNLEAVVVAICDPKTQIQRVQARYQCSAAEAQQRISQQLDLQEKVANADFVVDTNGSLDHTQQQVDKLFTQLSA